MRRRTVALIGVAAVATLAWPGPASAATSLGGYSGYAVAEPIHLEVYDPVLPLPSDPQVDVSIGYTKAATETGPVSRATASYLWPGDVLGDGFGQLTGGDASYPIQVNSKDPATGAAPATNRAQLTDGNGMTTASNDTTTTANVTGLGIAGPGTNLLGGLGDGLSKLAGGQPTSAPKPPDVPVPVSATLARIVTLRHVVSTSTTKLAAKSFTASAEATASDIAVLGGLITIKGLDMTAATVSDGSRATNSGHAAIGGLTIGGKQFSVDERGVTAAGSTTRLPTLPAVLTNSLKQIGISFQLAPTTRQSAGATASYRAQGLVITVDTKPLRAALDAPFGVLAQLVKLLPPQLAGQLGPLLNLAPKFVITVGDVRTSAGASPGYTAGGGGVPAGGTGSAPPAGTGGSAGGTGGGSPGSGQMTPSGGSGAGAPNTGGGAGPQAGPPATTPTAFNLPGLGDVPRALILAGLAVAAGLGWLLRVGGGFLLGGAGDCRYGLASGVPDLRKG